MPKNFLDAPGFHGDVKKDISFSHGHPELWTRKMTIWSVLIVLATAVAGIVFVYAMLALE